MAKEIRFKRLGKYEELYSTDKRYIRLQGGAGSGKSQAIAQYLLIEALSDYRHNIFCFRKVARSTRNSLFALFKDLITEMGLEDYFRTNKTLQTVTCTATQVSIVMLGLDDVEKVKSIRNPSLIWMEEATEFSKADFTQLDLRVRNLGPKNQLILSYNPISTENFIYKDFELSGELKGKELFIKSTYKDNIFLTKEYKETLRGLATSNEHAYQVYTLGNWANLTEGLIFPKYEIVDFIPRYAKASPYYGLDFGYTDPLALTQVGIWNGGLYMSELIYERNLTIPQLADKLKGLGLGRNDLIYSDSANPSDIQQLYDLGYTGCKPARKGKDSIMSGIRMMNQYKLYVTSQSVNLISELNKYCWVTDKEGNALERPIDAFNHCFTEDTIVETFDGSKGIKDIKVGELVRTSKGYFPCVRTFNNGKKQVSMYLIKTDRSFRYLIATKNHKVWTVNRGWTEIQEIKKGDQLYCTKGKNIPYTVGNAIFRVASKDFTGSSGRTLKDRFLRAIIFIIRMAIRGITRLKTLHYFLKVFTSGMKEKGDAERTLTGLKIFTLKESKLQRTGIVQRRVRTGIENTLKKLALGSLKREGSVKSALRSIWLKLASKDSVQINANHSSEGVQEQITRKENVPYVETPSLSVDTTNVERVQEVVEIDLGVKTVYDLMIKDQHEYFANHVLVHNCIDSARYAVFTHNFEKAQPKYFSNPTVKNINTRYR